jgi:uncharacterized protein (DUF1499 family)
MAYFVKSFALSAAIIGLILFAIIQGHSRPPPASRSAKARSTDCNHTYTCISSTSEAASPQLAYASNPITARENLLRALKSVDGVITKDQGAYIQAELSSYFFNIRHDVEFMLSKDQIHYRCLPRASAYALPLAKWKLLELKTYFDQLNEDHQSPPSTRVSTAHPQENTSARGPFSHNKKPT